MIYMVDHIINKIYVNNKINTVTTLGYYRCDLFSACVLCLLQRLKRRTNIYQSLTMYHISVHIFISLAYYNYQKTLRSRQKFICKENES